MHHDNYDQDSETSPTEVKPRPRRHRRKRAPQNSHDYKDGDDDATIANQAAISQSKSSIEYSSRDNVSALPSKSEKRNHHASRRLTKMSNTSEEVEGSERRRPRRKVRSAPRVARSVSEEVLALEGKTENVNNGSATEEMKTDKTRNSADRTKTEHVVEHHRQERRKSRPRENVKKRKARTTTYSSDNEEHYQGDEEYSEIFCVDKEDVVQPSDIKNQNSHTKVSGTQMMPPLPSQKNDLVYIEKKGGQGFVKEHKSKVVKAPERTVQLQNGGGKYSTLDFVLKMHLAFRSLSLIVQGLLAGLALSQCIFVYSLANQDVPTLLKSYHGVALPYQSIYYFLLAICNVSIFDRYIDISSGWSQFFSNLARKPSRAVALVSYLFALIFSVSLAQLDDHISQYNSKEKLDLTKWTKRLATWKIINLLRVIGSILGWVMVALAPNDDQTAANIQEKIKQEKFDEMSNGRNSMQNSTSVATWDRIIT